MEILLGSNWHTLFSDELWYLIVPPAPAHPYLEGRFQSNAPDRTGWPVWVTWDDCFSRTGEAALCRLALRGIPRPDEPRRFLTISDAIWQRAVEESVNLADRWPSTPK
jgi:hypothetical protein